MIISDRDGVSAESLTTEDYFKSILASGVSLEHVAQAKVLMNDMDIDSQSRHVGIRYYPRLWEVYSKSRSRRRRKVIRFAIGHRTAWGIVLFSDGTLDYYYPLNMTRMTPPKWEQLVHECIKEVDEVEMVLKRKQKKLCCAHLYAQLHKLFTVTDDGELCRPSTKPNDQLAKTLGYLEKETSELSKKVRDLTVRTDTRVAQQQYLLGMVPGVLIAVGLTISIHYLHFTIGRIVNSDLELAAGSGGVGALLSVLGRTTSARLSKSLRVDSQAGAPLIITAGAFRPIVGALLALAIYALIESGLLPVTIPKESPQSLYFIAAISLLAGFSERLAQDALVSTSRTVFTSGRTGKPDTDT